MLPKLNPPAHRRFSEIAQHLPCVSKRVTNVLLRQLHDNLRGVESSSNAWMCSRILSPFYVCFCCDHFTISLTESNRCELEALAQLYTLLANVNLSAVLVVARNSTTTVITRRQKSGGHYLQEKLSCVLFNAS